MPEHGISEFELSAWLLDALDPDRAAELAEAVARSPALAERARARRELLARLPPLLARPMPIPGSDWRGQLMARRAAGGQLGEALRPGDRVELRVGTLTEPERRELVAMTRDAEGRWDVVWPEHPDERTPVVDLERDEDGALKVSLSASPMLGTQRWLLVFPETPWPVDWSLPQSTRWDALLARISAGTVPLFTFELEVQAI
ncbi:hypothetical protein L6R49_12505 [Myxococcota bacterium]|nr:hypothetical protein [Myxococcota bacterium]